MRSFFAALRSLVLPYGRTSGQRIIIDGVNGVISVYNSSNQLVLQIDNAGRITGYNRSDGSQVILNAGAGATLDLVPPTAAGQTFTPGVLSTNSQTDGIWRQAFLELDSPAADLVGAVAARLLLIGASPNAGSKSFAQLLAHEIDGFADTVTWSPRSADGTAFSIDALRPYLDAGFNTSGSSPANNTDSGAITTTETTVDSVTASLVSGVKYWVEWDANVTSDATGDRVQARMREDNSGGTTMGLTRVWVNSLSDPWPARLVRSYTAAATGSKTFVVTLVRAAGSGNVKRLAAGSNGPSVMRVIRR